MAEERNQEQDLNQLLKVRREKLAELQANNKDPFKIVKYDVSHHSEEIKADFDALEGKMVTVAGRMMSKRVMGKASFCHVQDLKGMIQCYVARDAVGEEPYKEFKKLDVGDIIGVKGEVFKTKTGEISIHAAELTLLSKSLQVLPEKYHGMTNRDLRYRQRYVDLIMNMEAKDTFIKRSKIISTIRRYLDSQGFMEVETPMLVQNAGGAAARPFETHFNALDEDLKLRISLELYLKRLIVGGLERVYEIGRVFRNEGLDTRHNPEFTLMELYQAYTDYHGMMDLTENMYRYVAQEVLGTTTITYNGVEMDLGKPFELLHVLCRHLCQLILPVDISMAGGHRLRKLFVKRNQSQYHIPLFLKPLVVVLECRERLLMFVEHVHRYERVKMRHLLLTVIITEKHAVSHPEYDRIKVCATIDLGRPR